MTIILLAALAAQSADLLTWTAFRPVELNPLVAGMYPLDAVLAKVALLLFLVAYPVIVQSLPTYRRTRRIDRLTRPLLAAPLFIAILVGLIGAVSNIPWR